MQYNITAGMFNGTLRGRSDVLLVWINLLAHTDGKGYADKSVRTIADETGLTVEAVEKALIDLESPEIDSRCKEHEGRRIKKIDGHRTWGWQILNNDCLSEINVRKNRREYMRNYMAKVRAAKKVKVQH